MPLLNIQTWIQARRGCRLIPAGRHETCAVGGSSTRTTSLIRRWYRGTPYIYKTSNRDIYTLNPAKFSKVGQVTVNLSQVVLPTIRIFRNNHEYKRLQLSYCMKRDDGHLRSERWPANSRGFLYYYSPPDRPRIGGELRLRLTPTDNASFQQGKDFCFRDVGAIGEPWKRPLYSIATTSNLRPLYEKLIEEGLVSRELCESIQSLPKLVLMYSRCQIIYLLSDTFIVDLSSVCISLVALTENGISTIDLFRQFTDHRLQNVPYTGIVLARFEPSSLPEHTNTRTVVLRIVQELTPVRCVISSYDGYLGRPRQGELFAKRFYGKLRPWSIDLDRQDTGKSVTTGLNLLWGSTPQLERQRL